MTFNIDNETDAEQELKVHNEDNKKEDEGTGYSPVSFKLGDMEEYPQEEIEEEEIYGAIKVDFGFGLATESQEDILETSDIEFNPDEDGEYTNLLDNYEDISLIDASMQQIEDEGDNHLKIAALFGINLSNGKQSKGLEQDLTNILIGVGTIEKEEDESETELTDINKNFNENEIIRIKDIINGIIIFQKDKENEERSKSMLKQLEENNRNKTSYMREKRDLDKQATELSGRVSGSGSMILLIEKRNKGGKLTKRELELVSALTQKEWVTYYKTNHVQYKRVMEKIEKVDDMLLGIKEIENKILEEVTTRKETRNTVLVEEINKTTEQILNNTKKATQVQFGVSLYSQDFQESPTAVRCSCGHKDIYETSQLPYYMSGNIYDNYKERTKVNKNVKKNFFTENGHIKNKETRIKLEREPNLLESRIHIPGITESDREPLICKSCNSYIMFTPDIIDRLAERGFISDVFTAELSASKYGKNIDITQGVKIFLSEAQVDKKYITDLGLSDYMISKISKNTRVDDMFLEQSKLGNKTRIDEISLRKYADRPTGEINLKQVEKELEGHTKNINIAIDELIKHYKLTIIKPGATERSKKNQELKNERNEILNQFLLSSRSIILKYCIDNKISSQGLKSLVHKYETKIGELKHKILEFLVDYLIDSVIEGKPTFVFEEGYVRTINNEKMVLPHTNFFNCYRDIIKEYFLHGEFNNIKKDFELTEHYNMFRALSTVSKIQDYDLRVRKSEEFVSSFRDKLGDVYEDRKSELFFEYISDNLKLESNYDENQKCFGWLYYEMITQNKVIRNTEVANHKLFEELYGDKVRGSGHFYLEQGKN